MSFADVQLERRAQLGSQKFAFLGFAEEETAVLRRLFWRKPRFFRLFIRFRGSEEVLNDSAAALQLLSDHVGAHTLIPECKDLSPLDFGKRLAMRHGVALFSVEDEQRTRTPSEVRLHFVVDVYEKVLYSYVHPAHVIEGHLRC